MNSLAFTNANAAGNLIVVYVVWDNSGPVTLRDSRGNTYASVAPPTAWGANGAWRSQMFYAKNIASGTNTVTATFEGAITSFGRLYIHEYSGLDRTASARCEQGRDRDRDYPRDEQRLGDDHQRERRDLRRRVVHQHRDRGRDRLHEPPERESQPDRGQDGDNGRPE